jgi:hypothetical protein
MSGFEGEGRQCSGETWLYSFSLVLLYSCFGFALLVPISGFNPPGGCIVAEDRVVLSFYHAVLSYCLLLLD